MFTGRVTEETARIPSAVGATLTVLLAFRCLQRYLGRQPAFWAAVFLPVSWLWLEKVPSAEIDILQLAWVSAALFLFLRAVDAKEAGRPAVLSWGAALVCVTGGLLTKWTAPAFFYLAVIPFLAWRGRLRWLWGWDHLLAVAGAVGLTAAWASAVTAEVGWEALRDTVTREAAQRFGPKIAGKPYPWGESLLFPFTVLGANLPWSIPALLALRPGFLRSLNPPERRLVQLLHCWVWPNLLFWSLPVQHHVRYVLPITPAMTLLGFLVLYRWASVHAHPARVRAAVISILVGWVAIKVVYVERVMPTRTAGRNAREIGQELDRLVPPDQILYLCRLKDEGILFYYGRPACRLVAIEPGYSHSQYVLLLDSEWAEERTRGRAVHLAELRDQQKAPIHLIRFERPAVQDPTCPTPPLNPVTYIPSAP